MSDRVSYCSSPSHQVATPKQYTKIHGRALDGRAA